MAKGRFAETRFGGDMDKDKEVQRSLEAAKGGKAGGNLAPGHGIGNVAGALRPKAQRATQGATVVADAFPHDTAFHMAFVGAGQGGSRIANSFWQLGYRRVGLFNTTDQDWAEPDPVTQGQLAIDPEVPRLSLNIGGASKDMQLARQAMDGRDEEVWDLYTRAWGGSGFDCVLVCVGLGGGTGSGVGRPLARIARKYMEAKGQPVRVGAVVSLPSVDEGQQVARNAVRAFGGLMEAGLSPLIIIDNDRVHELYQPAMSKLLPKSNELVSQLFHLFNTLAAGHSPYITFDRSEFGQLLDGGIVVMGSADIPVDEIKTPASISTEIRDQLAHSVLAEVDLRRGKKAACVFVGSRAVLDTFSKDYFAAGFTQLNRIVGSGHPAGTETVVHRGLYPGDTDGLQCYTMISELDPPRRKLQALAKEAGLPPGQAGSVAKYLGVD